MNYITNCPQGKMPSPLREPPPPVSEATLADTIRGVYARLVDMHVRLSESHDKFSGPGPQKEEEDPSPVTLIGDARRMEDMANRVRDMLFPLLNKIGL